MGQNIFRRGAAVLGTALALTLSMGTVAGASALDGPQGTDPTKLGQLNLSEAGYSAALLVVSIDGAEPVTAERSEHTVIQLLESRGYNPEDFRDENGASLEPGQRLANGSQVVVYASTIEGHSETIELKLPEILTDDPELYEGQTAVTDPGKTGTALKTTILQRDLSKLSQGQKSNPAELDGAALAATATPSEEASYITVLEAPSPKRISVGTKSCGSQYLCDYLEAGGAEELQRSGTYVHPLGGSRDWTTYSGSPGHDNGAVDFPMAPGTPIYAVADGTVTLGGWSEGGGGNMVAILHSDGNVTGYAHMVEAPQVTAGDKVKAGQLIGFVGSTGNSTGPHLHFEVWRGALWGEVIPSYEYMRLHGIDLGSCTEGPCELSKRG